MIGTNEERKSGKSVLSVWLKNDDEEPMEFKMI